MAKYKEVFGIAKEKMSDVNTVLNSAMRVNIDVCAQIKTSEKKKNNK